MAVSSCKFLKSIVFFTQNFNSQFRKNKNRYFSVHHFRTKLYYWPNMCHVRFNLTLRVQKYVKTNLSIKHMISSEI